MEEEINAEENLKYAEQIVDNLNFKSIFGQDRDQISSEERKVLIDRLLVANCKRLFDTLKQSKNIHGEQLSDEEVSKTIIKLLINNGYKDYNFADLSKADLSDLIKNIENNNININLDPSAIRLNDLLSGNSIEISQIELKEFQQEISANTDKIFEKGRRFAGVIMPKSCGEFDIIANEMLKLKKENSENGSVNYNILFVSYNNLDFLQFQRYIVQNVLNKKIISKEEEVKIRNGEIEKDENSIFESEIDKYVSTVFPYLQMKTYSSLIRENICSDEKIANMDCDLIVLSEVHRAGAEKFSDRVDYLVKSNQRSKILGVTSARFRDRDDVEEMYHLAKIIDEYGDDELKKDEPYLAYELELQEAMVSDILVTPRLITFDYKLGESKQYAEVCNLIKREKSKSIEQGDPEKLQQLIDQKDEMDRIISNSQTVNDKQIFEQNMKKNGRYVIFVPRNPNPRQISTEEYLKQIIEEYIEKYFKDVNSNIKTGYLLNGLEKNNKKAISEFEDLDSDALHLIFAIDMLNECAYIDKVDGIVMDRKIGGNSKIVYEQQLDKCLFPIDSNSQIDQPVIFDIHNNTLEQNLLGKTSLYRPFHVLKLEEIFEEIKETKHFPDINSENERERENAQFLKFIQKRYKKFSTDDEKITYNLTSSEAKVVEDILDLCKENNLWNIQISDTKDDERISNGTVTEYVYEVTGNIEEFLRIYNRSIRISSRKNVDRLKDILSVFDCLHEYDIATNNNTIKYDSTINDVIKELSNDTKSKIMDALEKIGIEADYEIGSEYNFLKRIFYRCYSRNQKSEELLRNSFFDNKDFETLINYGLFEEFYNENEELTSALNGEFVNLKYFKFDKYNIKTKGLYDIVGLDRNGFDEKGYYFEKLSDGLYKMKWKFPNFDGNGFWWDDSQRTRKKYNSNEVNAEGRHRNGWRVNSPNRIYLPNFALDYDIYLDKNGNRLFYSNKENVFLDENGIYWRYEKNEKTGEVEFVNTGYDLHGLDKYGFDRRGYYYEQQKNGKYKRKWDKPYFDREGFYWKLEKNEETGEMELVNTGSKFDETGYDVHGLDKHGFNKDRYYYEQQKNRNYERKWDKPYFDREGFYWKFEKNKETGEMEFVNTGSKFDETGYDVHGLDKHGFDERRYYYEQQKNGNYERKWDKPYFDREGFYWKFEKNKEIGEMELVNTGSKFDEKGFNVCGLDEHGFSEFGYYFEQQGNYRSQQSKWRRPYFDGEGNYWRYERNEKTGEVELVNTESKFDEKGNNANGERPYVLSFTYDYLNGFDNDNIKFVLVKHNIEKDENGNYDTSKIFGNIKEAMQLSPFVRDKIIKLVEYYQTRITRCDERIAEYKEILKQRDDEKAKKAIESLEAAKENYIHYKKIVDPDEWIDKE